MPSYANYRSSVQELVSLLTKDTIRPLAFQQFENETGTPVNQVLPGNNQVFNFTIGNFEGKVDTRSRQIRDPTYKQNHLTVNEVADNPQILQGIATDVYDVWEDIFGEYKPGQTQIGHPGEPPFSEESLSTRISSVVETWELLCTNPMITDLVDAIKDNNHYLATRLLGADQPDRVLSPGHGHEMYNLFMNGPIHVIYQDSELALLKPEYDRDDSEEVLQQQWNAQNRLSDLTVVVGDQMRSFVESRWGNIDARDDITVIESDDPTESRVIQGEWPQEAFVVGVDDTQIGLFLHSIDGTRLNPTQDVTKEYIQDVMGFDRHYRHNENRLDLNLNERVRLQGDFAIQYISTDAPDNATQLSVPIDNHYIALTEGVLPENESKTSEPIQVQVPDGASINIAHDEHTNVAVELAKGTYELYLLHRGLKQEFERPDWNPQNM